MFLNRRCFVKEFAHQSGLAYAAPAAAMRGAAICSEGV